MQNLTQDQELLIIAAIDKLKAYRDGNVTEDGVLSALHATYISILKREIANSKR